MNEQKVRKFLQDIKQGYIRGESMQEQVTDNIFLELSVGSFEFGNIFIRVMVDEPRLSPSEGMYYCRLYKIDDKYKQIHQEIKTLIERENNTPYNNSHEWTAQPQKKTKHYEWVPQQLNKNTTIFFTDFIQLRNDITPIEALETNKRPENKPDKYKK